MVMEFPVIIQNGIVGMIQFKQMLQRPRRLLLCVIEVVNLNRRDIDSLLLQREVLKWVQRWQRELQHLCLVVVLRCSAAGWPEEGFVLTLNACSCLGRRGEIQSD